MFTRTIYIKVYPNKITLRHIEDGKTISVTPATGFTTHRLLVGQFTEADNTIKNGMRQLNKGNWFSPKPTVIIHAMEKIEGGLSQVEERILIELAASAGARRSIVWLGHELSDQEVLSKAKNR